MRTKNILGFDKMMETIQNWVPDYNKVVCALTYECIKANLSLIRQLKLKPISEQEFENMFVIQPYCQTV